jgi:hypothetical protein
MMERSRIKVMWESMALALNERQRRAHRMKTESGQKEWTLMYTGYNLKRIYSLFRMKNGVMPPVFKITY